MNDIWTDLFLTILCFAISAWAFFPRRAQHKPYLTKRDAFIMAKSGAITRAKAR